ncbi:uncharacterized protein LOC119834275 [Zerene cesonia]|uniref:uncharacterized protein LOC119834275 n=1 Tax=Zerene cesonia TaxID=33412 RepID=UPI0018E51F1A|nr:uncharacterized protein LOC119834275 [Zerene cesonia]
MTDNETRLSLSRPTPLDIVAFIPYACYQMEAQFEVRMLTRVKKEYVSVVEKNKKSRREKSIMQYTSTARMSREKEKSESQLAFGVVDQSQLVLITVICDTAGRLVELLFQHTKVPLLLLEVIGFCLPYQPYLNRITIRWGAIDGYSIYEMAKHLRQSQITEICLDDSPVAQCNQYLLLENETNLKFLSLERCGLVDRDCIRIAAKLVYPQPASRTLRVLSLASNTISDEGAVALGTMLRSNRQLRFLNLSGNQITNSGAAAIFSSLMEFPMTYDEIVSKRARSIEYLNRQKEVYMKCYKELINTDTIRKDAYSYSIGNLSLSYLNLSYNNLGHESLVKLLQVIRYQESLKCKTQVGLVKVMVEGNPMPCRSGELEAIQDFTYCIGMSGTQVKYEKIKPMKIGRR